MSFERRLGVPGRLPFHLVEGAENPDAKPLRRPLGAQDGQKEEVQVRGASPRFLPSAMAHPARFGSGETRLEVPLEGREIHRLGLPASTCGRSL